MPDDITIDLSRYKTSELASTVGEILAVPESIWTVVSTTISAGCLLFMANSLLYSVGNPALIPWLLSSIYTLIAGIALGFALGLIRVARLLVSRSERVLQLTLETSREVDLDYRAVRSGDKRMPTSAEIVEHVYESVVLPAMEASVSHSLGIVGRPLLWIYRRTIGGCVRFVIIRMKTASQTRQEQKEFERDSAGLINAVGENYSSIESSLQKAQGYTRLAVSMIRSGLLIPLQVVFAIGVIVALIPIVLCWYWTR